MTLRKERFASNPFQAGVFNGASFSLSAEISDTIVVSVQLKDASNNVAQRVSGICYISDDANGDSIAATAPTSVTAGTDGALQALVAGKVFLFTSEADGQLDVSIERTVADVFYLVIVSPDGSRIISQAITFV